MQAYSLVHNDTGRHTIRVLLLRKEGETIQFLSTGQVSRGEFAELIFSLPPGAKAPQQHCHVDQTEHLEVLSGMLKLDLNGEKSVLGPGASFSIPPGTPHSFGNASGTQPLVVQVGFSSARNIEWYFMQMACSAIRNGGRWKNVPLLESATIHWTLRKEFRFTRYPAWLQQLCFGSLMVLAKFTGAIKNIKPLSLHKAYVR